MTGRDCETCLSFILVSRVKKLRKQTGPSCSCLGREDDFLFVLFVPLSSFHDKLLEGRTTKKLRHQRQKLTRKGDECYVMTVCQKLCSEKKTEKTVKI